MNNALIELKVNNSQLIFDVISPEILEKKSERANVKIIVKKNKLVLNFKAKDINALKVFINHVLRLIMTVEKASKIKGVK